MVTDEGTPTGDGEDGGSAADEDDNGHPDGGSAADAVDREPSAPDETTTAPTDPDEIVGPTDEEIVAVASDAAEGLVFSRYRRSDVRDVDVTVEFEDGVLEVDVYLNVPDADVEEHVDDEAEQVADDAALAALDAVDRLFEEDEA